MRLGRTSPLHQQDLASLYPTLGSLTPNGEEWLLSVSGMVFREGKLSLTKKIMLGILRRALRASREALETELFQSRIRGFLVDALRGRHLHIRLGEQLHSLKRVSKTNGFFHEDLRLKPEILENWVHSPAAVKHATTIPWQLVTREGDAVGPQGEILCLPRRGLSVISDIDDTIKETSVHCRKSMLANTFLQEFQSVTGMANTYQNWLKQGAAFHYVSSSPWQLYHPLSEYLQSHGFPAGSMHLRAFRLRDHMLRRLFLGRKPVKGSVIRSILQRFPLRKFVLIGDSGEYDPEIYGALARKFPQQIAAIHIRRVHGTKNSPERMAKAFRGTPTSLWFLFEHPDEINLSPWLTA
jgi:phosphatidate phosphatase APP1